MYLETLDRRSSRPAAIRAKVSLHEKAARKDSAVHVSLSSDSLFKQPGSRVAPISGQPETRIIVEAVPLPTTDRKLGHYFK